MCAIRSVVSLLITMIDTSAEPNKSQDTVRGFVIHSEYIFECPGFCADRDYTSCKKSSACPRLKSSDRLSRSKS
jgi:hypothetical protein